MSSNAQRASAGGMSGKEIWYYAASVIGVLITFGFGYLPPIGPITPIGMQVMGIFLGMIFLWSFVSTLWPSLVGIVALVAVGYNPTGVKEGQILGEISKMSFGNTVPVLLLFIMVFFGAIQHAGVTRYISRWFLTRKVINGKPVMFSFVFIYATYALSALASTTPALLFMWAILYSVLDDVGYKKGDKYTAVMVIGTMFGAISGQAAKPFVGSALMIGGAFETAAGHRQDYLLYMLFGFILCSLGIALYALLIKFVFRPDMSKIAGISIERFEKDKLPPMDARQKTMMASLFFFLVLVLLPSTLPKEWPVVSMFYRIGPLGTVMLFVAVFSCLKIGGRPILEFKEVAGKFIIWDVYLLVCMAMAISAAMANPSTGITQFLKMSLDPILGGHSFAIFSVILIIFGVAITQFANNGVMGVLLMPVIKIFSDQAGGNFEALATVTIFAMHIAILTPAASPYAAMIYGNKDWISPGEVFKYGLAICIMTVLLYVAIGIPMMHLIY